MTTETIDRILRIRTVLERTRAQPRDHVPEDAERHLSPQHRDQHPLRRLARVRRSGVDEEPDVLQCRGSLELTARS